MKVGDKVVFTDEYTKRGNRGRIVEITETTDKDGLHQSILVRSRQHGLVVLEFPYDGVFFEKKYKVWRD